MATAARISSTSFSPLTFPSTLKPHPSSGFPDALNEPSSADADVTTCRFSFVMTRRTGRCCSPSTTDLPSEMPTADTRRIASQPPALPFRDTDCRRRLAASELRRGSPPASAAAPSFASFFSSSRNAFVTPSISSRYSAIIVMSSVRTSYWSHSLYDSCTTALHAFSGDLNESTMLTTAWFVRNSHTPSEAMMMYLSSAVRFLLSSSGSAYTPTRW